MSWYWLLQIKELIGYAKRKVVALNALLSINTRLRFDSPGTFFIGYHRRRVFSDGKAQDPQQQLLAILALIMPHVFRAESSKKLQNYSVKLIHNPFSLLQKSPNEIYIFDLFNHHK